MSENPVLNDTRRYLHIVFFVSGLLLLTHLAGFVAVQYYGKDTEERTRVEATRLLDEASQRFVSIQRETRRITTDLARNPLISSYLEGRSVDLSPLFGEVAEVSRTHHVGVEVFDDHGQLVAWSGTSGPVNAEEIQLALQGKLTSYIIPSSLYSQLFVATPVRSGSRITGVVLVRNTVDTHYPLNNRYVDREGLSETILRDLGIPVRFDFGDREIPAARSGLATATLYGIDSTRIGSVSVAVPTGSAFLEEIEKGFDYAEGILHVSLITLFVILLWKKIKDLESVLLKSIALTATIWLTRYALLWLDLPSLYFPGGVFDPVFYASKFGNGLAKSIGELTLTSFALLVNTLVVTSFVVKSGPLPLTTKTFRVRIIRWGVAIIGVVLFFLLLRAYGVIIRSAVFDSALQYNDPAVIIPSFELAVMVVNLLTMSLCIVVALAGLLSFVASLVSPVRKEGGAGHDSGISGWVTTGLMLGVGIAVIDFLGSSNLMTWEYRLIFSGCLLLYAFYLARVVGQDYPRLTPGGLLITLWLSARFQYPQLDTMTQDKDR